MRNNGTNALIEVTGIHESGDILCRWAFDQGNSFRYHPFEFGNEFKPATQEFVDSIERQICPEHGDIPQVFAYSVDTTKNPLPDRWDVREDGFRHCSFCGSLHPDDLISLIKEYGFGIIEPTTKNYKWYVRVGNQQMKYYRYHDCQYDFVNKYNALISERNANS